MRHIIVFLLMMLVMWQNVSFAAMPCHASPHNDMSSHSFESSMHAEHDMSAMSQHMMMSVDSNTDNCCTEQCYCPTSACNNVHFVHSSLLPLALNGILFKLSPPIERLDAAPIYSLYKPPIQA